MQWILIQALQMAVLPAGVWQSSGYGYVLNVDEKRVQIFEVSKAGCVEGEKYSREAFEGLYGSYVEGLGLDRFPTKDPLQRLATLPDACRKPLKTKDSLLNFNVYAATMEEQYPFFGARKVDWKASVAAARARVNQGDDLFDVLSGMVRQVGDGHLTLEAGKRSLDIEKADWKALRTSLRESLQDVKLAGNRRLLYKKLAEDVGYLAVLAEGGWAEGLTEESPVAQHLKPAREAMNQVLREMRGVKAMVLDLRVNSGGYDAVAMEIASRFAKDKQVVFRKHATGGADYEVTITPSTEERFEGPVAVLIGENTVSAGETLALAMSALPGAMLIGQPTRGELSDAIPKRLPNGWSFTVSIESVLTKDGTLVEAKGVQPGVLIPKGDWASDIALALTKILNR
jgi:hypothetical protein